MPPISKEDNELSKIASGLPNAPAWKNSTATPINPPSNGKIGTRIQKSQNPFSKARLSSDTDAHAGRVSRNPNRTATVFDSRTSKRLKTQSTSASADPMTDDAKPLSRSSVVTEDSDDSLLITSKGRIANDGPATQRLSGRRDAGSSKVVHSDTETEVIEDFLEMTKKPVSRVKAAVRQYESRNGTPKLPLDSSNPLAHISPVKPKSRVKLNISITEPTLFKNGNKSKVPALFLENWIGGPERSIKPREHLLSWETGQNNPILKVMSTKGHRELTFNMKSGIEGLEASKIGVSPLIVKFGVPRPHRLGSNGLNETVAFRVDTEDRSCDGSARKALYDFLKDKCECKAWLDDWGAQAAWDVAVQELNSVASGSKDRKVTHKIPTTYYRDERRTSAHFRQELPPSIELPLPPGGEMPLPQKTSQRVEQMNRRPMFREPREVRETVKDESIAGPSNQPLRRSSRRSTVSSSVSEVDPIRASPSEDPDELLLVYRPPGTGAVNITRGDFERLTPGKYLNDTLIEFGLKLWLSGLRDSNPELANQIHLFSSFFYKKLAIKDKKAGYESVRKWTSKVDVFSKKYLVVPINEHLHWYLAIIYQPEYTLRPAQPPPSPLTRKRKRDEEILVEALELRETPTIASKPTSKATTDIPGEIETIPDSEPSSPRMEPTQTDETIKPEEQEVEIQLCADVSSVSLDEQEGLHFRKGEQDDSGRTSRVDEEGMVIDNSPPASPMPVDLEVHIEDSTKESTPLETVEPSVHAEGIAPEAPTVEMDDAVPVDEFYGSKSVPSRTYSERKPRASAPGKLEGGSPEEDLGGDVETVSDRTYIFVFDSLNGKHPGAMKNLAQYLRYEAEDKKGIENPSSPSSLIAHVPTQDNYCDCGLYLLHFAKVFMEDPAKSFHTILTKRKSPKADRDVDWKKELVGTSREDLTRIILDLSEEWVKERAKEAEEKAKAKEREGTSKPDSIAVDSPEESDDDVILEEFITLKPDLPKKVAAKRPEPTKKGPASRGKGRTSPKTETGPAEAELTPAQRLR